MRNRHFKIIILPLFLLFFTLASYAQNKIITGTVSDDNGGPVS